MRILHVYKDYYPVLGGIENHVRALAEAQAAAGHTVSVLVTAQGREGSVETCNGVTVTRAGRLATIASTPISLALPRMLAKLSPEVTHLHFPYPIGEISQFLLNRGRTVITYHSDVVRGSQQLILRLYRPLMRLLLRRAAQVIVTSPNYVVSSPHLRRIAERCLIVPLGIDVRVFQREQGRRKDEAEPARSLAARQKTVLFLGCLRYYKGIDTLLHAMPLIDSRLVVGGAGPMQREWELLAQRLGLAERVRFTGNVPAEELADFYHSGDLFVLPASARSEAFGTVLLEAMAAGLACVTTELGTGTSFVVQDGATGLVVPPHSPRALADAINRLLADDGLRLQMGQAGLARVQRDFTLESMVKKVDAVYSSLRRSRASATARPRVRKYTNARSTKK